MKKINFVKMHGAGNDFVMIDDRDSLFPADDYMLIASLCERRTGIGSEGLILVQNSDSADFKMRFFNPDGTEAELCGNGARCVAAFARSIGAVDSRAMRFETLAGMIEAEIVDDAKVKISMPPPKDLGRDFVVAGVPHKIIPVDNLAEVEVEKIGREIRLSEEFAPHGTNVDFVTYHPSDRLSMRTYERGVEAESGACGTGAVAAAVVGVASHSMEFPVKVTTVKGYSLVIDGVYRNGEFSDVTLTGPVKFVFSGSFELP